METQRSCKKCGDPAQELYCKKCLVDFRRWLKEQDEIMDTKIRNIRDEEREEGSL